jgi:hypothetical protein
MKTQVLSSISAVLVVASWVPAAIAEPLSDHPAVVVARTWNNRPIDTNTFIIAPPASTHWVDADPKSADESARASESSRLHWSAAIGTGYTARATETGVKPNAIAAHTATPDWTASIGTGTAATSGSIVSNTKEPVPSDAQPTVAATHWTSNIGSGHASDSASPPTYTSVANIR